MISPTQSDIGRAVVYRPHPGAEPEQGVITDVRGPYVFVRYGADQHSKATAGRDLEWVAAVGGRA